MHKRRRIGTAAHVPSLLTVGHSTHTVDHLLSLLKENNVATLVDIRTVPRPRTNPQHNKDNLEIELPKHGVSYIWLGKELGGFRKPAADLGELNAGWRNASFRGYADYMQTPEFEQGLTKLMELAEGSPTAIMCSEVVHFRCHRGLVSDALCVRGWKVAHITRAGHPPTEHKLTKFAVVDGERITYPPYEEETEEGNEGNGKRKAGGGSVVTRSAAKRQEVKGPQQQRIDRFLHK